MVNFDKFSSENTVIFADFSPKITVVRPKYVSWGSIQEGVGSIDADMVLEVKPQTPELFLIIIWCK